MVDTQSNTSNAFCIPEGAHYQARDILVQQDSTDKDAGSLNNTPQKAED